MFKPVQECLPFFFFLAMMLANFKMDNSVAHAVCQIGLNMFRVCNPFLMAVPLYCLSHASRMTGYGSIGPGLNF